VLAIAVLFAVGGVAFAAGRLTAPAATAAATNGTGRTGGFGGFGNGNGAGNGGNGTFPGRGNGFGGAFGGAGGSIAVSGTVSEIAADHITLTLANGQSVTIPVDASTQFHRQAGATSKDVTAGTTVQVTLGFGRGAGGGAGAGNGSAAGGGPVASPDASGRTGIGRLGTATDVTITVK
jgi:hypothetical protein